MGRYGHEKRCINNKTKMKKIYEECKYRNNENDRNVIDYYDELAAIIGHRTSVYPSVMMESTMNGSNSSVSCPTTIRKPTNICVVSMCMARRLSLSNSKCNRLIARIFFSIFVSFCQQFFYFTQILLS